MIKTQFFKILLLILGVVMVTATSYAAWKIYKDIDKPIPKANQTLLGQKRQDNKLGEINEKMNNINSQNGSSKENPVRLPIYAETPETLFNGSDVIAYSEIISVDKRIEEGKDFKDIQGIYEIFPEQHCQARFLRILKGEMDLQNKTVSVVKEKSRFYLAEKEKMVLYLSKQGGAYYTIDKFGGEHRLGPALCDIRNLKTDGLNGGIVVSVLNNENFLNFKIHVLKGRLKTSLKVNDADWNKYLLKSANIDEFNICEIPLEKGIYTVLIEIKDNLYSYTYFTGEYYPAVIIGKYRWWEPLEFNLKNYVKN